MRKISEMYQRSGGTSFQHECGECCHYSKTVKVATCELHGQEPPAPWKENYIACKFFADGSEPPLKNEREFSPGQLSIFDFIQ